MYTCLYIKHIHITYTICIYNFIYKTAKISTWKSFQMTLSFASEILLVFTSRVLAIAHKTANIMAYSISGTLHKYASKT